MEGGRARRHRGVPGLAHHQTVQLCNVGGESQYRRQISCTAKYQKESEGIMLFMVAAFVFTLTIALLVGVEA